MMKGVIQGRESFLSTLSSKLNRPKPSQVVTPSWEVQPQWEVYKDFTQDDLLEVFLKSCGRQGTETVTATSSTLENQISNMIQAFGGGPIVASKDPRFLANGIEPLLKSMDTFFWTVKLGDYSIDQAKQANIGISFSDQALAESGTTIFYHNKDNARSISLLPKTSIVIVTKSQIVPRLTQATQALEARVKAGEAVESYINMISGPSNSADIEMNMVVGVHGPIKVGYILLEDQ